MKSFQTAETTHNLQATKSRRVGIALVFSFFAAHPVLPEAKIGSYIVKPFGKIMLDANPDGRHQVNIDRNAGTIISSSVYTYKNGCSIESTTTRTASRKNSPPSCTTDAGDLAMKFQQTLVAVNKKDEEIHVGNLLSASEQLEASMRKIGFVQSANDIKGNVAKIRNLYDRFPAHQRDYMPALLRYEIESGLLDAKGARKIPEKSATMGFLWLGRSLNYQYDMFSYMLDTNCEPFEAARRAYDRDLKPHLSWPIQKVCQAAMTSLKSFRQKDILAKIGGFSVEYYGNHEDQATRRDLRKMMNNLEPMLSKWKKVFSHLELESV